MANPYVTEPILSGLVKLNTSQGEIQIELWPKEAPKACRNFVQLALEGYYDGCTFHRIVPGFVAQTGDPTGTGSGGDCIYDEGMFEDEFSNRLKFTRRGLVAMANLGKRNTNTSQFFFTLDRCDELQNKNTIFGSVVGDTIYNVLKIGESEVVDDRPVYPPLIKGVEVLDNPFDDIVPRITPGQRKAQQKAKKEAKAERERQQRKTKHQKLAKNKGLLSFAGDEESEASEPTPKIKFKSAHDVDTSGRLSSQVVDDRPSLSSVPVPPPADTGRPTLPSEEVASRGSARMHEALRKAVGKRKVDEATQNEGGAGPSITEKAAKKSKKDKQEVRPELSKAEQVKADIAKLQSELRGVDSDFEDETEAKEKKKSSKHSGASLLAAERAKYNKSTNVSGGQSKGSAKKRGGGGEDVLVDKLEQFRRKLKSAGPERGVRQEAKEGELGYAGEVDETQDGALGDKDGDDEGWMSHMLQFRKDATIDLHKAEEYKVIDPLSEKRWTLDELAARKASRDGPDHGSRRDRDRDDRSDRRRDWGRDRDGGRGRDVQNSVGRGSAHWENKQRGDGRRSDQPRRDGEGRQL